MIIAIFAIIALVGIFAFIYFRRKKSKTPSKQYYLKQWIKIQKLCPDKKQWVDAVLEADALLEKALKEKKFHGKSVGEKLVSAQKHLTNNDAVWYSHKLKQKITETKKTKLTKKETITALAGFRQALIDLGFLPDKTSGVKK